ncbi:B12-binding domain-containing radical SAM protein [Blautia sp. NSJ-166]|uniref:B12-binding domain-containing radical SAM protein n=1 Tax=Blautia sp. NSJ-166 TaxID=2931882 RepID=UPI0015B4E894|nr:B12-binding domain-containing radical SAM protein [Blautia sp. NSJ-166]MCJ8046519.1 B12-binding domain-containing radical SAM protein [Blautia sp. NSJ-166]
MKILLAACNAKYIHSNLAVYNLKSCSGEYSPNVVIKEYTINQIQDDILKDIYLEQPDVICFSCYIWNISFVKELVPDLKKILPHVDFWAGGPEVSYDAVEFLKKNPAFFGVMVGEGEETFHELAGYYIERKPENLKEIRGVAFHDETKVPDIVHTGWRELMDLSKVPFAYSNLTEFKNRIIYYESSRGCPFSCSYCLSSIDKKLRFRDIELVKKELQFFIDNKVPQVKFVDRTFNCKHDHAMAIWRYITEHDNGITNFHFEISADLLREEELALMKTMRPGLIQLEIGVQSTNPQTIKAIRRTMDFEKLKGIVEQIHSFGNIHQHLDLIAGLPYEGYESFHKSFCDVYALRPEQFQLGFLKVLKGSHMMEMTGEYQILYKDREPYEVLSTAWLTYGEILGLKMVESMVEVYYNSGQFKHTLVFLEQYFEDPFRMYEALGRFYEKKGYSEISHSRMRRYEILMEFAGEQKEIPLEVLSDVMLLDLYLRENLKSRPSFASDQKPYERLIWDYRKVEKIPKTAHIEVFRDGKTILFDYTDRDPLTNNARLTDITDEVNKNYGNV